MNAILTHILTGKDGSTHDLGRWSWAASMLAVIAGGVWNATHTNAVDLIAFAQAIATVVGAHGLALWAKKDTEPQ